MGRKNYLICIAALLLCVLAGCAAQTTEQEKTVEFSQTGGIYETEFSLELTASDGSAIYYTTDGSDPADSDTAQVYQDAIRITSREGEENVVSAVSPTLFCTNFSSYSAQEGLICYMDAPAAEAVDKCTVIRAAAKDASGEFSKTVTQTYFIGTTMDHFSGIEDSCAASGSSLAVISITMDYDDLFDEETGIYVKGNVFADSFADFLEANGNRINGEDTRKLDANYSMRGREWERSAHVELYETDAEGMTCVLTQDCGIRIQGNYSRSDLQKSFRLYARKEYEDNNFRYPIWGDDCKDVNGETMDAFKTFILRAGGNCAFTAKYNDTFWQTLAGDQVDCSTKNSRPCIVYLNGEYWGLYVLEEDYSADYFEDHYHVEKENVVVYKGDAETYECGYKLDEGELPAGVMWDSYYFDELFSFFETHESLASQEDYEAFCKLVDEQSVLDYFAVEVWINNKWDWPGKNWSMWKTTVVDAENEYADGRWRFCLYDVEFGGVSGSSDAVTNTVKEDNYKPKGLLDFATNNPAVLCFAYLMTNEDFREAYCSRLTEFSETIFEKEYALNVLTEFENTYGPLFHQFYARYPESGSYADALYGGYASSKCIRSFLEKRAEYIPQMIEWIRKNTNG